VSLWLLSLLPDAWPGVQGAKVAFTYVSPKEDSDAAKTVELLRDACKDQEPLKIPVDFSSGEEKPCKEVSTLHTPPAAPLCVWSVRWALGALLCVVGVRTLRRGFPC